MGGKDRLHRTTPPSNRAPRALAKRVQHARTANRQAATRRRRTPAGAAPAKQTHRTTQDHNGRSAPEHSAGEVRPPAAPPSQPKRHRAALATSPPPEGWLKPKHHRLGEPSMMERNVGGIVATRAPRETRYRGGDRSAGRCVQQSVQASAGGRRRHTGRDRRARTFVDEGSSGARADRRTEKGRETQERCGVERPGRWSRIP